MGPASLLRWDPVGTPSLLLDSPLTPCPLASLPSLVHTCTSPGAPDRPKSPVGRHLPSRALRGCGVLSPRGGLRVPPPCLAGHIQTPFPQTAEILPDLSLFRLHILPLACSHFLSIPSEVPEELKLPPGAPGFPFPPPEPLQLTPAPPLSLGCRGRETPPPLSPPPHRTPGSPSLLSVTFSRQLVGLCTLAFSLLAASAKLSHSLSFPVLRQACAMRRLSGHKPP